MNDSDGFTDIPESIFSDDDGSADARLAQALIRYSRGRGPLIDVVDALAYARVLIPVMASGEARHIGKHGLEQDEVASTGVVAVQMPDGRTALPVFTDVDAMRAWNDQARPIPAEGPRAALAAVAEEWSNLVVNPGMESVLIPRPAVWALGQGNSWQPAVIDDVVVEPVAQAVTAAVPRDEHVKHVEAVPGRGAEVAVVLRLVPGLTQEDVNALVQRVQGALAASETIAQRVDSLEIRLAQAT
jgi:hypothetical protein